MISGRSSSSRQTFPCFFSTWVSSIPDNIGWTPAIDDWIVYEEKNRQPLDWLRILRCDPGDRWRWYSRRVNRKSSYYRLPVSFKIRPLCWVISAYRVKGPLHLDTCCWLLCSELKDRLPHTDSVSEWCAYNERICVAKGNGTVVPTR